MPGLKDWSRLNLSMRMAKQEARQKTPRTGRVWAGADRFAKIGTSIWTLPGSPKLIEFTLKP